MKNLQRHPHISRFTSAQSFMRDDEVLEIVLFPYMRQFRRIADYVSRNMLTFALEQASCISKSETLEEMQISICGSRQHDEFVSELQADLLGFTDDKRVTIYSSQERSWLDLLRSEFIVEAEAFISESM
jgi:hypothetical protein